MRLPRIQYRGVESLSGESKLRSARAWSNALGALGDTARQFVLSREKEMVNTDIGEYRTRQAEMELKLRNPYLSPEDIPAGIQYEATKQQMVNGQMTDVPRTQIPTYEVQSAIMDKFHADEENKARAKYSSDAYRIWKPQFDGYALAAKTRNGITQFDAARAADKARTLDVIEQMTDSGNYEDAILMLQQSGVFTEAEQLKEADRIRSEATLRPLQDAAMNNDLVAMQAEREKLVNRDHPEYDPTLDPPQRQRAVAFIDAATKRAEAEAEAAVKEQQSKYYSDLLLAVDTGKAGPADVERAYQAGRIDEGQRTAARRSAMSRVKKETRGAETRVQVADVLAGRVLPPMGDTQFVKDVNREFADVDVSDANSRRILEDIAISTGVITKNLSAYHQQAAAYGNAEEQTAAVESYNRIKMGNPFASNVAIKDGQNILVRAQGLIQSGGYKGADAVERARRINQLPKLEADEYKARVPKYEEAQIDLLNRLNADDSQYNTSWFSFDNDNPLSVQMVSDFRTLIQTELPNQRGDVEVASAVAYSRLMQRYGTSRAGIAGADEVPKRMPIDRVYRGTTAQLNTSIAAFAQANGYQPQQLDFMADRRTETDQQSWLTWIVDEDGVYTMATNEQGLPQRFNPYDWPTQAQAAKAEAAVRQAARVEEKQAIEDKLEQINEELGFFRRTGRLHIYAPPELRGVDLEAEKSKLEAQLEGYNDVDIPAQKFFGEQLEGIAP